MAQRKLTGIKQRIARLPANEKRRLHDWLGKKLAFDLSEAREEYVKLLRKLKPGTKVMYWSHRGVVARATNTYVYVHFEPPIRYNDKGTPVRGLAVRCDGRGSPLQVLGHLPGFGAFEVFVSKGDKQGAHLGRTPIFAHALEFAMDKTCAEFDVVVAYPGGPAPAAVIVTPQLRAQFLFVRQQIAEELKAKEKPVGFSLPANNPKEFLAWLDGESERVPDELK